MYFFHIILTVKKDYFFNSIGNLTFVMVKFFFLAWKGWAVEGDSFLGYCAV
jgi:hypothetical protein